MKIELEQIFNYIMQLDELSHDECSILVNYIKENLENITIDIETVDGAYYPYPYLEISIQGSDDFYLSLSKGVDTDYLYLNELEPETLLNRWVAKKF